MLLQSEWTSADAATVGFKGVDRISTRKALGSPTEEKCDKTQVYWRRSSVEWLWIPQNTTWWVEMCLGIRPEIDLWVFMQTTAVGIALVQILVLPCTLGNFVKLMDS